jgi:hypothetical protein
MGSTRVRRIAKNGASTIGTQTTLCQRLHEFLSCYDLAVRSRLPSLNGLRAFEAAARHLSFTRAAAELNVTQTAISHQVRRLEEQLRLRLFARSQPLRQRAMAGAPC